MKEHGERYSSMMATLKKNGYKLTPQRLAIARILSESEDHPSVEDIFLRLQKDYPGVSEATVYRNVVIMKSLGEVIELGFAGEKTRYDGVRPYPHPHLICIRCKKIIDPELESLVDMTREIVEESDFKILTFRLDFFGLCSECSNVEG